MLSDERDVPCKDEAAATFGKPIRRGSWKDRALVLDTESGCVDIQRKSDIDECE